MRQIPVPRTSPGLSVRGLTVRFRGTTALNDVDLSLGRGVHGLLGPNGAGKTSLLRVLATVARPTEGDVRILGLDPQELGERTEIRRRLGYLPQEFGYYPTYTVREMVTYLAWLKDVPGAQAPAAVERAAERVGLGPALDKKLRTLSGGEIRRVGIAQAVVNEPDLLLLDEPTAGLDPERRLEFRGLLRELGETATVLVSTHLVEDVAAACAEVTLLEAGRPAFRGTPDDLIASAGTDAEAPGDSPLERGYTSALRRHRSERAQEVTA
ncbi:ABC transporter ATP-binding protein [Streptomyces meridianus]|uniref:ABC transporter ATP-binding protein n=1 Tax=Streptomyces meridianus TaxID=2938945 RepID=A0ABT0X2N6_9ACTN|nr:ABC transporter ATP-binding protein [Streptomyces meridianus]MCM2576079.1 ABC transporter ATP-binding protein [Streptomyces meridianus]